MLTAASRRFPHCHHQNIARKGLLLTVETAMPAASRLANEEEILLRIRQRIKDGRLPVVFPERVNAGSGHKCAACDEEIINAQIEYDVQDARDSHWLRFHLDCYAMWQSECSRVRSRANGGSD